MPSADRERQGVKKQAKGAGERSRGSARTPTGAAKPSFSLERASLRKAKILVVGDVMLDRYWFGDVSRISPEAPVPVLKYDRLAESPGGAANVARNAAALGAKVDLLSVVGKDEPGKRLAALLKADRVNARLHRDASIETTVKLRVIGPRHHQLLRIDFERTPSHEVLLAKLGDYRRLLEGCDVVVLSDYGKGGLTHIAKMIGLARAQGKQVLVDPKGDDYSRYAGATLITPNRNELREVVGGWASERELAGKAIALRRRLRLKALLVTLGEDGLKLFQDGAMRHEKAKAREVSDVSGAGDTVIATLAVMMAAGAPLEDAARIANYAAGIKVGKFGTAVVHREELIEAMKQAQ
jgi:D-glycero-beta-D-manno-heptose-7-phosphate kinase